MATRWEDRKTTARNVLVPEEESACRNRTELSFVHLVQKGIPDRGATFAQTDFSGIYPDARLSESVFAAASVVIASAPATSTPMQSPIAIASRENAANAFTTQEDSIAINAPTVSMATP